MLWIHSNSHSLAIIIFVVRILEFLNGNQCSDGVDKNPFVWEVQMAIIIFKNNWQSSSSTPQSSLQVKYGAWMPSQCLHGGHPLRFSKNKKNKKNVILKYSRRLALKLRWGMANNQKTLPALVTTCQTFREAVTSWAPGLKCWHYFMKTTNSLVKFIFKGTVWGTWGPWSSTGHSWAWMCRQLVKGDLASDGDSNELSQESLLIISWYKYIYEKWGSSVVIRSDFADAGWWPRHWH